MPILPEGMLDSVSSPVCFKSKFFLGQNVLTVQHGQVPFIAGIVANTKEKMKMIENDSRVEHAMSSG